MKILFFGRLAERIGREIELDLADRRHSIAELRSLIRGRVPEAADALATSSARACVDQVIVLEDFQVNPGQEIAFIPPLSGG